MKAGIAHSRPWITKADIEAVKRALEERSVCSWRYAERLSAKLAKAAGFQSCSLYASGTLALRAALACLRLPPGSAIAIPAFTCQDVLNAVCFAGYRPCIIDCDDLGLMRADLVASSLRKKNIKGVVAVHQFGLVNVSLGPLAGALPIIEDCSHVPPAQYLKGSKAIIGSLEGTKLLGAGEGGYFLFNGNLIDKIAGDNLYSTVPGEGLSDIIAALALSQTKRIAENIEKRRRIANKFSASLSRLSVIDGPRACWFRFLVRARSYSEAKNLIRLGVRSGITLRQPIMPHPLNRFAPEFRGRCPNAEKLWRTIVSVPIYPDLSDFESRFITRFLEKNA